MISEPMVRHFLFYRKDSSYTPSPHIFLHGERDQIIIDEGSIEGTTEIVHLFS